MVITVPKHTCERSIVSDGAVPGGPAPLTMSINIRKTNLFVIHQNKYLKLAKMIRQDRWQHEKPTGSGHGIPNRRND